MWGEGSDWITAAHCLPPLFPQSPGELPLNLLSISTALSCSLVIAKSHILAIGSNLLVALSCVTPPQSILRASFIWGFQTILGIEIPPAVPCIDNSTWRNDLSVKAGMRVTYLLTQPLVNATVTGLLIADLPVVHWWQPITPTGVRYEHTNCSKNRNNVCMTLTQSENLCVGTDIAIAAWSKLATNPTLTEFIISAWYLSCSLNASQN